MMYWLKHRSTVAVTSSLHEERLALRFPRHNQHQILMHRYSHLHICRLHPSQLFHVTSLAEEVVAHGVAPLVRLVRQLHLAHLAHVAVHVEVLLHRDHADGLLSVL